MKKSIALTALTVSGLLLLSGCYSYSPPPTPTEADTFTERKTDKNYIFPDDIKVLDLEQAQNIAIRNNPDFRAKYQAVVAARARYYQAMSAYLPQVTSSYVLGSYVTSYHNQVNTTNSRTNAFNTQLGIQASWLIFDGLARTMGVLAAKHSLEQSKADEDNSRRIYLELVATSYNNILLSIEQRRIAKADMDFQLKILKETQLKYEAGAVPLSDVLNFKIQVNVATGNQIAAEYQYNISRYALATLMGLPEGALPESLEYPPIQTKTEENLTSIGVYLDAALNNRPDLKYYREAVKVSEYTLYQRWGAFSPKISAFAGYDLGTGLSRFGPGKGYNHSYVNTNQFSYGAEATWSLFEGGYRIARVREAQALVAQAKFIAANTWITVVKEVRGAYDNYVQNVKQAQLYEKTLDLVTKQRDLVEEEYKAGNTELTRLNQAQRDLVEADTNFVIALVNVKNARAQLEAATNSNTIGVKLENNE